jgi:threonine synthase
MDVGNPSNFARLADLYQNDIDAIRKDITGYAFTDAETTAAMQRVSQQYGYTLDPHGAVAYLGLRRFMDRHPGDLNGIFLETAHPAKFRSVVEKAIGQVVPLPSTLEKFVHGQKQSVPVSSQYDDFKETLKALLTK